MRMDVRNISNERGDRWFLMIVVDVVNFINEIEFIVVLR